MGEYRMMVIKEKNMTKQKYKPIQVLLLYRPSPTGKLANEETEDFERLGSFSFLLALFFFFHKKKKKAVTYDPSLGRFLQADSVVMPNESFGMNRYMYVSGSPVRFGDSSGHKKENGLAEKVINTAAAMMYFKPQIEQSGADFNSVAFAAIYSSAGGKNVPKDIAGGMRAIGTNIGNTAKWASGGMKNAADQFNKMTGQDYEKRSRVGYGHCAGAAAYGPLAPPVFGLCMSFNAAYEYGVRGGWDKTSKEFGGAGGISGVLSKIPELAFFGSIGIFFGLAGIAAGAGDHRYRRERDHRNRIANLSCLVMGFQIERPYIAPNIDVNDLPALLVRIEYNRSLCFSHFKAE
jgi:hypothetical protein